MLLQEVELFPHFLSPQCLIADFLSLNFTSDVVYRTEGCFELVYITNNFNRFSVPFVFPSSKKTARFQYGGALVRADLHGTIFAYDCRMRLL